MKNMKLTNLSLSVLIALGLVACGGSDNKDNAPVDQKPNTGDVGGGDTNNNQPQQPTDGKDFVKKPTNEKTGVEGRFKNDVNVNFKTYANRSGQDTLAGYIPSVLTDPNSAFDAATNPVAQTMVYEDGATSVKDIKRASSIVNYLQAGWVNSSGDPVAPNAIRLNPLQTYALGDDGKYYRVKGPTDPKVTWDKATATDKFTVVSGDKAEDTGKQFKSVGGMSNVPASKLFYIPNVMTLADDNEKNKGAYIPKGTQLGSLVLEKTAQTAGLNVVNPKAVSYEKDPNEDTNVFDVRRHDVKYEYVKVDGKKQAINATNGSNNYYLLDLGTVNKGDLTKKPIELGYGIHDNKGTSDGHDDDIRHKETKAGELRVYDVSYSRALLEVNQAARDDSDAPNAEARNGLGFAGTAVRGAITDFGNVSGRGRDGAYGPFQVMGSTNGTIPVNGRAHYYGKSFGVNSIGDIDLEADFGVDRATVGGVIENRTNMKGDASLPDMNLEKIILSQPAAYRRDASVGLDSTSPVDNGVVHLGGEKNWGTWAVRFYGPNALSAAGVIAQTFQPKGGEEASKADKAHPERGQELKNVVEVFNAERGDLEPTSLNN